MIFNEDDRAQRLLDIFPHFVGQTNVSYIHSTSHVTAWHKHEKQTDYWICIKGALKVGLAADNVVNWVYLSDKNPRVLEIKPGIYHGYRALKPNTILLYYVSAKYDPNDEYRLPVGHFGESWETENK